MDQLLIDNPQFVEYAVRDAVITEAYWMGQNVITQERIGPLLFQTDPFRLATFSRTEEPGTNPEGLLWPPQTTTSLTTLL